MKIRKSRSSSEQPSLQSAQGNEKHEDEVDMGDAELLTGFSHGQSDQYEGQWNSTAPSTKSEDLPEMEVGKEVAIRSVNPCRLQGQDGGEYVTSMANSLGANGDVEMENQGERSEELTGLAMPPAIATGAGASYLHPLLIEEGESDSERPSWLSPSKAPEGSLLHTLYLQLVDAGSDGITLQELFKCFENLAEGPSFGTDWILQVQWHLKTNPHFCKAKGYHYLLCNDQLELQQTKRSPANIASTSSPYGASSSKTVLSNQHSTPATLQPGLFVNAHKADILGVAQNRWTTFQKAIEFEEMHQSMANMQMPSSVADSTDSQLVSHEPLWTTSRKRKSLSSDDEEFPHYGHPIPDDLQATQAEIFAKTEVQTGRRCDVQKDDTGNSRCNMMALANHPLCNHHWSLQLREDGRTSLSPIQASRKHLSAFKPWIAQDEDVPTRVQCGHRHKSKDGTRSSQCNRIAMHGHKLCEDHKQRREDRKARQRSDAQQGKQGAKNLRHNQDSSVMGLPESHIILGPSPLSLHPKSATISPPISREDTLSRIETAKALKSKSLIRTPTIPPLPPPYGVRRKTPVKHRDQ